MLFLPLNHLLKEYLLINYLQMAELFECTICEKYPIIQLLFINLWRKQ
jgi:hypothetical protein